MGLRVVAPGPCATIQDGGRFGYRAFGVPTSGPFDRTSAAIANALVRNPIGAAVLELTGFGGFYEAESDLAIGLAGAPMSASVERTGGGVRTLTIPCATQFRAGDRLIVGGTRLGHRLYVATRGGWLGRERLGSRSDEEPIAAGDVLPARESSTPELRTEPGAVAHLDESIRFLADRDAPPGDLIALERAEFRVGQDSTRMGLRLEGARIGVEGPADRLSVPVVPGTIQVAGGLPIVLGPACGTMGGYPVLGHVLGVDLDRLGQAPPGGVVRFRRVELVAAREIECAYRAGLRQWVLRLATGAGSLRRAPDD